MAKCVGLASTLLGMIVLCCFQEIQMSINLKNQLTLDGIPTSPSYPVSGTTDGVYGPYGIDVCMSSYGATLAWWRGTLPSKARIQRIDIVFRGGDRANGFTVWVSNDIGIPSGNKCYEDVDPGFPDVTQNITSCNVTGQRVMITISRTPPAKAYMDLCEVDVYGCYSYKYGDRCQHSCTNCKHGCNPDNGVCDSTHCSAGWSGPVYCYQPCSSITFGENCAEECHCKKPGCNRMTGFCDTPGCQAGYHGRSCNQVCPITAFGESCSLSCHCSTPGCDSVTGHCNVPGCAAGWLGESCHLPCSSITFGKNCAEECHCKMPGCNGVTGVCHTSGCQAGYYGSSCSQECVPGLYGADCDQTCSDRCYEGCDRMTGVCNGCKTGKYYAFCDKSCPQNCKEGVCNQTNGHCKECQDGYYGVYCDYVCPHDCNANFCIQTNGYCSELTSTDNINTAAVGIGAGCGVIILVLVILVIVQTRRLSMKNKDSTGPVEMADISQQAKGHDFKADADCPYEDVDTENGQPISESVPADDTYEKLNSLARSVPNVYDTVGITVDVRC